VRRSSGRRIRIPHASSFITKPSPGTSTTAKGQSRHILHANDCARLIDCTAGSVLDSSGLSNRKRRWFFRGLPKGLYAFRQPAVTGCECPAVAKRGTNGRRLRATLYIAPSNFRMQATRLSPGSLNSPRPAERDQQAMLSGVGHLNGARR